MYGVGERLDKLDYIYDQEALSSDGSTIEIQYLKMRVLDGDMGSFFQLVFPPGEKETCWSFSSKEDLLILIEKLEKLAEAIRS